MWIWINVNYGKLIEFGFSNILKMIFFLLLALFRSKDFFICTYYFNFTIIDSPQRDMQISMIQIRECATGARASVFSRFSPYFGDFLCFRNDILMYNALANSRPIFSESKNIFDTVEISFQQEYFLILWRTTQSCLLLREEK